MGHRPAGFTVSPVHSPFTRTSFPSPTWHSWTSPLRIWLHIIPLWEMGSPSLNIQSNVGAKPPHYPRRAFRTPPCNCHLDCLLLRAVWAEDSKNTWLGSLLSPGPHKLYGIWRDTMHVKSSERTIHINKAFCFRSINTGLNFSALAALLSPSALLPETTLLAFKRNAKGWD